MSSTPRSARRFVKILLKFDKKLTKIQPPRSARASGRQSPPAPSAGPSRSSRASGRCRPPCRRGHDTITLSEARSWLDQRRFSRPNAHFAASFKIYKNSIFSQANFVNFRLFFYICNFEYIFIFFSEFCNFFVLSIFRN